jgi:antitoxin Phd
MNIWPVQATKDGAEAAVLASVNEWRRLQRSARPTLKSLLLSEGPRWDFPVPKRRQRDRRMPPRLD